MQIENLEDLLKEKDNQVDMARARLTAMQAHHCSSEGALSSLEEAIGDKEKQMNQLREQRDRAEGGEFWLNGKEVEVSIPTQGTFFAFFKMLNLSLSKHHRKRLLFAK